MAKEWLECEDVIFADSLLSLQGEIHTLAARGRVVNARLNIRELLAPMLYEGPTPPTVQTLFSMMRSVSAAKQSLELLGEKLSLLAAELSLATEGGVA